MEKNVIPNLRNACRILSYMADHPAGIRLQSVIGDLNIPRTTAFRILKTLQAESMVREENRKFFLGAKLIHLGQAASGGLDIRKVALPHLRKLTKEMDETCHLAVPYEGRSLILEVSLSPHPLRATSQPGTMVDLHCSSTGKVFLAFVYKDELARMCESGQFAARTKNTLHTYKALEKECESIRHQNYSVDDEEYHEGVRCIAVPVRDATGSVIASVGLVAARQRFPKAKIPAMYDAVKRTALAIARDLGSQIVVPSPK